MWAVVDSTARTPGVDDTIDHCCLDGTPFAVDHDPPAAQVARVFRPASFRPHILQQSRHQLPQSFPVVRSLLFSSDVSENHRFRSRHDQTRTRGWKPKPRSFGVGDKAHTERQGTLIGSLIWVCPDVLEANINKKPTWHPHPDASWSPRSATTACGKNKRMIQQYRPVQKGPVHKEPHRRLGLTLFKCMEQRIPPLRHQKIVFCAPHSLVHMSLAGPCCCYQNNANAVDTTA